VARFLWTTVYIDTIHSQFLNQSSIYDDAKTTMLPLTTTAQITITTRNLKGKCNYSSTKYSNQH